MTRACIIGHPVAHSRSPLIHGYWLRHYGLEGHYAREDVEPAAFPEFLRTLDQRGYVGANVTLPHKEAAFAIVEQPDEAARALGALNTVWLKDGRLHGANTDVIGFIADLDARLPGWDQRVNHAVVLGAGGAARGIIYGLLQRRIDRVSVVNRSHARAEQLAAQFGPKVKPAGWVALPALLAGADLLVNTTSLGMAGQPPLAIELDPLQPGAAVADIVYVPLETNLLVAARTHGHAAIDGLGMLLHQAVPGFERWFGVRPEVTPELRALVEADIVATMSPGGTQVMIVLGLTGSIGMGKSATAQMFIEAGVPVHDADAAVHRLYRADAVPAIEARFPGTTSAAGVDREALARRVLGDAAAIADLEAIVHPLVRADADAFVARHRAAGCRIAVLDIPLLFETGAEARVDAVVVASAPKSVQRARVLARPGMTEDKFAAILMRQMPDEEKRRRAHFVVDTGRGFEAARTEVHGILRTVSQMAGGQ